ncbi:MAG: hypothetical protein IKK75_09810 [Clostridia bacterium]|nr:hypothetical protein [Clostridia bacterium]
MSLDEHSFGSIVKKYIQTHDISYQNLVDELGFKSKTSVSRIIQDDTSFHLRLDFYERFASHYPFTDAEKDEFEFSLQLSQLCKEQQDLYICFKKLLCAAEQESGNPDQFRLVNKKSISPWKSVLTERSQMAYKITALVLGVTNSTVLSTLYNSLDSAGCVFSIRHYLFGDDITRLFVHTITEQPHLFDPRYQLFNLSFRDIPLHIDNQIILHYDREDGSSDDDLLIRLNDTDLYYQRMHNDSLFCTYDGLFERVKAVTQPIKVHERLTTNDLLITSTIQRHRFLLQNETRSSVYSYRKELGIEHIPPEIFKNALQMNYFQEKDSMKQFSELTDLQYQRYQNIRSKRSPSYYILSHEALKNFIWTGRLKSHPLLLRPFTAKERAQILTELLTTVNKNPFFYLRIAADNMPDLWNSMAIHCCQQLKRASSRKNTKEDMLVLTPTVQSADEYTMIPIQRTPIASAFAIFFMQELWNKCTLSTKRSLQSLYLTLQYQAAKFSNK